MSRAFAQRKKRQYDTNGVTTGLRDYYDEEQQYKEEQERIRQEEAERQARERAEQEKQQEERARQNYEAAPVNNGRVPTIKQQELARRMARENRDYGHNPYFPGAIQQRVYKDLDRNQRAQDLDYIINGNKSNASDFEKYLRAGVVTKSPTDIWGTPRTGIPENPYWRDSNESGYEKYINMLRRNQEVNNDPLQYNPLGGSKADLDDWKKRKENYTRLTENLTDKQRDLVEQYKAAQDRSLTMDSAVPDEMTGQLVSGNAYFVEQEMQGIKDNLKKTGLSEEEVETILGDAPTRTYEEDMVYSADMIAQFPEEAKQALSDAIDAENRRRVGVAGNYGSVLTEEGDVIVGELDKAIQDAEDAKQRFMNSTGLGEEEYEKALQAANRLTNNFNATTRQVEAYDSLHTGNPVRDTLTGLAQWAGNVAGSAVAGFGGVAETVAQRHYADTDSPVDIHSDRFAYADWNQNAQTTAHYGIKDAVEKNFGDRAIITDPRSGTEMTLGDLLADAYDITISMVQSILIGGTAAAGGAMLGLPGVVAGGAGLIPYGAGAYTGSMTEAMNRGLTEKQAEQLSTIKGLLEMASEVASMDKVFEIYSRVNPSVANILYDLVTGSIAEGSEELVSNVGGRIADKLIAGDKSEHALRVQELINGGMSDADAEKQVKAEERVDDIKATIGGAVSGLGISGIHTGLNIIGNTKAARTSFQDADMARVGESISDDAHDYHTMEGWEKAKSAKSMAADMAEKQDRGEKISGREYRKLYETMTEALEAEAENSINVPEPQAADERFEQRVVDMYAGKGNNISARDAVAAMARAQTPEQLVEIRKAAESSRDSAARAAAQAAYQLNKGRIASENNLVEADFEQAENTPTESEAFEAGIRGESLMEGASEALQRAYKSGEMVSRIRAGREGANAAETVLKNGRTANITGITGYGENMTIHTSEGNVKVDDMKTSATRYLYEAASKYGSEEAAQTFIEDYDGKMPVGRYTSIFDKYYAYGGTSARSFEDVYKNDSISKQFMQEEQLRDIYGYGQKERAAQLAHNAAEQGKSIAVRGTGVVKDLRENQTDLEYKPILEAMARATGMDIILQDDMAENINGTFNRAMQAITLNTKNSDNVLNTLFHEGFGEVMQAHNAAGAARIQQAVMDYIAEDEDMLVRLGRAYQDAYIGVEGTKTFYDAMSEMVNDSIAGLFSTQEGIHDFSEWAHSKYSQNEARGVLKSAADYFKGVADSFKTLLQKGGLSKASRRTAEMAEDRAREIRKMILHEMDVALENARKAGIDKNAKSTQAYSAGGITIHAHNYLTSADINDYIHAGNRYHVNRANRFAGGERVFIGNRQEFISELRNIIDGDHTKLSKMPRTAYGRIGAQLASQVTAATNGRVDIGGFFMEIIPKDIWHSFRDHEIAKEPQNGDLDMSFDDFLYGLEHINDGILLRTNKKHGGGDSITVGVPTTDGVVVAIEIVSKSNGSIAPKTVWKMTVDGVNKEFGANIKSNPVTTASKSSSPVHTRTAPNQNISQSRKSVNVDSAVEQTMQDIFGDNVQIETDADGEFQLATAEGSDAIIFNDADMRYSLKTVESTKDKLRQYLMRDKGHGEADVNAVLQTIDDYAKFLQDVADGYQEMDTALNTDVFYDVTGQRQVLRSLLKNGEYPVNIDFMTICKKRQAYMRVLSDLIDDGTFAATNFSSQAIAAVNDVLRDKGYETACLACFVESRRLQIQKWSETFCDAWNRQVRRVAGDNARAFDFGKNPKGVSSYSNEELQKLTEEFENAGKKNDKGNLILQAEEGDGKAVERKMADLLSRVPSLARTLQPGDILKTNGVANLRAHYGDIYSLLLQWYGSNTPKVNQDFNPYNGEFMDMGYDFVKTATGETLKGSQKYKGWAKNQIEQELGHTLSKKENEQKAKEIEERAIRKYLYDIGGARLQSFSDFLIENTLDYIQMVSDLAAREFPMHAYSKEISFIRIFGMTGMKLNMSLIPVINRAAGKKMAGLNPDGSYAGWGDFERHIMMNGNSFIQSIGWKDAIAMQLDPRYSKNIGTIAIGISDAHIRKMLDDPLIRMIIPYHKSGIKKDYAKRMNVDYYTNYEKYQITKVRQFRDMDGRVVKKLGDNVKYEKDFNFNEAAQRLGDARAAADEYLRWCREGQPVYIDDVQVGTVTFIPEFEQFSGHRNYYKVLEDFNMYDAVTEEAAPQGAVTMTFRDENHMLSEQELQEYADRLRATGQFTEKEVEKYVDKARMDVKDIIRGEAIERNQYRRNADANYDDTYKAIKDELKKYERKSANKYSLEIVEPVQPSKGAKWFRGMDYAEIKAMFPNLFNTEDDASAEESERAEVDANNTQVPITESTYAKVFDYLEKTGFKGTILDASSGRGLGTLNGRERGLDVEDIEPYYSKNHWSTVRDKNGDPVKDKKGNIKKKEIKGNYLVRSGETAEGKFSPMYTDYSKLRKTYDFIINNAVINVLSQDQRDQLVIKMGKLLNPGGTMFINVRGTDEIDKMAIKSENAARAEGRALTPNDTQFIDRKNHEVYVAKGKTGSIQKGYTLDELKSYLNDALNRDGDYFEIKSAPSGIGDVAVFVTKKLNAPMDSSYDGTYSGEVPAGEKRGYITRNSVDVDTSVTLKTLKGSPIKRSKWGVGKDIGGQVYFHKNYVSDLIDAGVIPQDVYDRALELLPDGFEYNTLMYDYKAHPDRIRFDSAPNFDTAREPYPGEYMTVDTTTGEVKPGKNYQIWHHKWQWVKDDYTGFDVGESYLWSKQWLQSITNPSGQLPKWNDALRAAGLPLDDENNYDVSKSRFSVNVGYHAGDLGKAESLGNQSGNRGTGHFGTGTYFVGNESDLTGNYANRPHETVDFSDYNLYTPKNYRDGMKLHEFLKGVNEFYDRDENEPQSLAEWERRVDDFQDKVWSVEGDPDELIQEANILYGEYDVEEALGQYSDVYDALIHVNDRGGYHTARIRQYERWNREAKYDVQDLFGISGDEARDMIRDIRDEIAGANYSWKESYTADSASTRFMKRLGYEGVDVRGINGLDNTMYGSVIYDLKGEALQRKYANGARYSVNVDTAGRKLSDAQQEFFKDSMVLDDEGRLKVMYHGSRRATFTIFDSLWSDDRRSLFFTDDLDVARTYSGSEFQFIPDQLMPFDELADIVELGSAGDWEIETNDVGGIHIHQYDDDNDLYFDDPMEAQTYVLENLHKDTDEYAANYEVYLNLKNPYIVDAQGSKWFEIPDRGGVYNTRDISEYAERNGYDGAIIHNVVDNGNYGVEAGAHDVVIAFDGNQVKSVANENPTRSFDIRRSVVIDNFFGADYGRDDYTQSSLYGAASILAEGADALKGKPVNEKLIKRIASELRRKYGSTYDLNTFADNLQKVFAYAQSGDGIDYNDLMNLIAEVAQPVIDEATQKVGQEEHDMFIAALGNRKIRLTDAQKDVVRNVFGSYSNFQRAMRGVRINDNGSVTLDQIWGELVDAVPGMLDYDVTEGDMPLNLYDAMSALEPTVENVYGEDNEEAAADLAMEIVERYYEEAGKETGNEAARKAAQRMRERGQRYRETVRNRYNERLKGARAKLRERGKQYRGTVRERYDQKLRDHRAKMRVQAKEYRQDVRGRYDQKLRDAKADMRERSKAYRESVREDSDLRIAKMRAKNKQWAKDYKERREVLRQRGMTQQYARKLMQWAYNPNDQHHIPQTMLGAVTEFLTSLDFVEPIVKQDPKTKKWVVKILHHTVRDSAGKFVRNEFSTIAADSKSEAIRRYKEMLGYGLGSRGARTWQQRMQDMQDLLNKVKTGQSESRDMDDIMSILDQDLADELQDLLTRNRDVLSVSNLNSNDLKTLNRILRGVTHAVNVGNRSFMMPDEDISVLAHDTMDMAKNDRVRRKEHSARVNKILDNITLDMATPLTYFKLLGKGGYQIYKGLRKAFNTKTEDIRTAQEWFDKTVGKDAAKQIQKWTGKKAEIHEFKTVDGTIRMTTAQLMSLYELSKRQQAMLHTPGGFTPSTLEVNGKQVNQPVMHLTEEMIREITDTLTPEQKRIADAMQQFMANQCSEWGNEAALLMYGYEKFGDPDYFPISTDRNSIALNNSNAAPGLVNAIKNSGFTKKVTPNARNPIVIHDIFDVFTNHVTDMAAYHGYAPAITDAIRWFNYRKVDTDADTSFDYQQTVQGAIQAIYGASGGKQYFVKLIGDLNQQEKSSYISNGFVDSLISHYKVAAVGGNVRVVLQQPTAFVRALNVIDGKYLLKALSANPKTILNRAAYAKENNMIAWWKGQGYFETAIGKNWKEMITGVTTVGDKLRNIATAGAGFADDITWGALYRAVELEQEDVFRKAGRDINSEEYRQAVNDRFDEMVDATQVVDATLLRTQYMRSQDMLNKLQTAFMAEPMKSYNMLLQAAVTSVRDGNMKSVAKAGAVFTLTSALTAFAAAIVDAFRRDDDESKWLERFLKAGGGNMADNVNPLNLMPVIKDFTGTAINVITGESTFMSSSSRMDMDAINNMLSAAQKTAKYIGRVKSGNKLESGDATLYGVLKTDLKALSQLTGIPAYALWRDLGEAPYNFFNYNLQTNYKPYGRLQYAINTGEFDVEEEVDKLLASGREKDKIASSLRGKYAEKLAEQEGTPEGDALKKDIMKALVEAGYEQQASEEKIEQWMHPEIKEQKKDSKGAVFNAINTGGDYKAAIEDAVAKGNTYQSIESALTSEFKGQYTALLKSDPNEAKKLENRLVMTYDYLNEREGQKGDSRARIQKWAAEEPAPENVVSETTSPQEWEPYVSDYQGFYDTFDAGSDPTASIGELLDSGKQVSNVRRTITTHYKQQLIDLYKTDKSAATAMKQRLIKAYMATGMTFDEANDKINDWF